MQFVTLNPNLTLFPRFGRRFRVKSVEHQEGVEIETSFYFQEPGFLAISAAFFVPECIFFGFLVQNWV
jgi:hypothetical protein